MKSTIATALVWLVLALPAVSAPGQAWADVESIFSSETNQYGTAGDGATVLHQGVYDSRAGIEPFVDSFVSGFMGLNGLSVDAGRIFFSVVDRGQFFNGLVPIMIEASCGYRYEMSSGMVTPVNDWTALGIHLGNLDALDHLWDGSIAFSTERSRSILQNGSMFPIRHENLYRFDPLTGTFDLFFDAAALGVMDLDAADVLESGRVVFSTTGDYFILTPRGGVMLRHQNAYLARDLGNLELMFNGAAMGLNTLDAIDVDMMMLGIDGDLVHWSALTTSAPTFDLVRGDLFELFRSHGDYSSSTLECLASNRASKSVLYPNDPDPGEGFWFVVRETGGSYDSDSPSQSGSRDLGIAASGSGCP